MLCSGKEGFAPDVRPEPAARTNVVLGSTLCFGYLLFVFVCEGSPELLLMLLTE